MGLLKTSLIVAGVFTLGGSAMYINAQSGDPQLVQKSLGYSFDQTANYGGELAMVPSKVVTAVKPGVSALAHEGGGLLGATTPTSTGARTDEGDTTATTGVQP